MRTRVFGGTIRGEMYDVRTQILGELSLEINLSIRNQYATCKKRDADL